MLILGNGLTYVRYFPDGKGAWTLTDPTAGTIDWDIQWHVDGHPLDTVARPVLARMLQDARAAGVPIELEPPPHGAARIWVESSMLRPLTRRERVTMGIRGVRAALAALLPGGRDE